ncbi:MAG TPA: hypothetical protein VN495_01540 [Candidatus Paceibacterota bacterium]|nr:hypothetical protein [Candidatus Paceibacterota bacterium]
MKKDTHSRAKRIARDVVVRASEDVQALKRQSTKLVQSARNSWQHSEPRREQAKKEMQKATNRVVAFGKDLKAGVRQGFAEVQKRRNDT